RTTTGGVRIPAGGRVASQGRLGCSRPPGCATTRRPDTIFTRKQESMTARAQIGVTGLAVMGRNLARNFARHGYTVAVHNRSYGKTRSLVEEAGDEGEFVPSETMADFVASLERPRKVVIMVKAGAATDAVID